jgi:hypothetical protein
LFVILIIYVYRSAKMAALSDQTNKFADHIQRMLRLVFRVDSTSGVLSDLDLPGVSSFDSDGSDGIINIDLSELGEVQAVLLSEVTPDNGTATIVASVDSEGALSLVVDSSLDLTGADAQMLIELEIKREL